MGFGVGWYSSGMSYIKEFDRWNNVKKNLQTINMRAHFKEREVWWCQIGVNVGYEIDGKQESFIRPVLVFRKISADTFVGIPLTRKRRGVVQEKNLEKFCYVLEEVNVFDGKEKESVLDLSQIRLFDARRLMNMKYRMHEDIFDRVANHLKDLLF